MAYGMFGGGTGTAIDPFLIEDANDLDAIRRNVTAYYKLVNNINLGVPPFSIGKGWDPIRGFSGKLDGNGKKIINLYINLPDSDNVGLFGDFAAIPRNYHGGLMVWDLGLENISVSGKNYVGGLLGRVDLTGYRIYDSPDTIFARITVAGHVEGMNDVGGLIGCAYWDRNSAGNGAYHWWIANDIITKCDLFQKSTAVPRNMAGIIGYAQGDYDPWGSYQLFCILTNVVSICTYNSADGSKVGCSHMSGGTYNWRPPAGALVNCYYDFQLLNGNTPDNCVALTTQEFNENSPKMDPLKLTVANNKTVWRFKAMKYPELWFSNLACYFVRSGEDYLTYDDNLKQWIKQFDILPSTPEILQMGMQNISTLDTRAWSQLKSLGTIEIVNFLENTEKLFVSNATIDLLLDNSQSDPDLRCFRKEIIFEDYNDDIVSMTP